MAWLSELTEDSNHRSDYRSPKVRERTAGDKGRGLFLEEPCVCGELLLISHPFTTLQTSFDDLKAATVARAKRRAEDADVLRSLAGAEGQQSLPELCEAVLRRNSRDLASERGWSAPTVLGPGCLGPRIVSGPGRPQQSCLVLFHATAAGLAPVCRLDVPSLGPLRCNAIGMLQYTDVFKLEEERRSRLHFECHCPRCDRERTHTHLADVVQYWQQRIGKASRAAFPVEGRGQLQQLCKQLEQKPLEIRSTVEYAARFNLAIACEAIGDLRSAAAEFAAAATAVAAIWPSSPHQVNFLEMAALLQPDAWAQAWAAAMVSWRGVPRKSTEAWMRQLEAELGPSTNQYRNALKKMASALQSATTVVPMVFAVSVNGTPDVQVSGEELLVDGQPHIWPQPPELDSVKTQFKRKQALLIVTADRATGRSVDTGVAGATSGFEAASENPAAGGLTDLD
eukprot:TRINITY_DN14534_c0_g1_i3.p1 TRINITY_DN14534_c0_g1~~TRINITY_DN14534_c0_g1_i3.p1  ORF type:complete len:477 (-),score=56.85 TRINITY_DN14534_c0_g1_i3:6-1364(-)